MFPLRPAVADDATRIRELVRAARINPTGFDWQRFTVAVNPEGDVIACGQIKTHRDGSAELASLVVDPDYRGCGIARTLVEHLTRIHQDSLYLMCRASLDEFYTKLGFQMVSQPEMPSYFSRISRLASLVKILQKEGETLLVMRRKENPGTPQPHPKQLETEQCAIPTRITDH
jgi:N-acetylglutamate synthase-like GNAT family acetyltransferase